MEALHQPQDVIGDRYRILEVLGQGGIGTTYKAEDLQTQQQVALKALSLRRITDWKVLELFEREARVLSYLQHPAIPRYLNYFQVDTPENRWFYLVQELAEGRSLAQWVKEGWRIGEAEAKQLAIQVLEVLSYLHSLTPPVIHRDIKPQNILRHADGQIFLVDFGAVQDTYRDTLTQGSTVVGTYGYMAPEQFRGKAVLATDLYGLGATLLFLLTHQSPADLPQRRLKIDIRACTQLSSTFANWLDQMLEPAMEDRFPSAKEALAALQAPPRHQVELASSEFQIERQPAGSRIQLKRTAQEVLVDIPPQRFLSRNLGLFGFALVWNGFIFFWTSSAIAMRAPIFFPLFSIPFWMAGLTLLGNALGPITIQTYVEINRHRFRLQQQCLGWRYRQVEGNTEDLETIQWFDSQMRINDQPVYTCALIEGVRTHQFGSALTHTEQKWLAQELSTFLAKVRSPKA
ncbi:serine/threonine protein kinase [Trichocoleus sp. FACHB-591]|uniref:serine/threonine protein kinase n=1 Tax=Trichocoleus sp. FACHB-591 TaxID=2692872 RepID=UPI001684AE04|nr:serine/threonine-protein kinase [Trichocoleus sp. FACHB-591]MBD2098847.1 serine/threonine protein kinase [Trichocoleus sp. FACHB-591]